MALLAAQAKEAGSLLGPPTTTVVAVVVVVVWARDPNKAHKTDQCLYGFNSIAGVGEVVR